MTQTAATGAQTPEVRHGVRPYPTLDLWHDSPGRNFVVNSTVVATFFLLVAPNHCDWPRNPIVTFPV